MKKYINATNTDSLEQPLALDPVIERRAVDPFPELISFSADAVSKSDSSIGKAVIAALLSSIFSILVWLLITILSENYLPFIPIFIGLMVGITIQKFGKGASPLYGILGAVCVLFASFGGNVLVHTYLSHISFVEMMSSFDSYLIINLLNDSCKGIDLFFCIIAIAIGYFFSVKNSR